MNAKTGMYRDIATSLALVEKKRGRLSYDERKRVRRLFEAQWREEVSRQTGLKVPRLSTGERVLALLVAGPLVFGLVVGTGALVRAHHQFGYVLGIIGVCVVILLWLIALGAEGESHPFDGHR